MYILNHCSKNVTSLFNSQYREIQIAIFSDLKLNVSEATTSSPYLYQINRIGRGVLIFLYLVYVRLRASLNLLKVIIWNCLHQYKQLFEKKIVIKVCIACVQNSKQTRLDFQKRCDGNMRRVKRLAQIGLKPFPKRCFQLIACSLFISSLQLLHINC